MLQTDAPPVGLTAEGFRRFMGCWPTGVAVVGMLDGGACRGMTANSLVSVSLSPLMIAISVRGGSRADHLLTPDAGFTVSILADGQERLAAWFSRVERTRLAEGEFDGVPHGAAPRSGAPFIRGAVGFMDCVVASRVPAGDHVVLISTVQDLRPLAGRSPLAFYRGRWAALRILTAAQDSGR